MDRRGTLGLESALEDCFPSPPALLVGTQARFQHQVANSPGTLLVRYGVASVFAGHDHIYERIKPQKDIQYFVVGAGGQLRRGNTNRRSPLYAAGNDLVNSFMYVELKRDSLSFWAVDAAGRILDGGVLSPKSAGFVTLRLEGEANRSSARILPIATRIKFDLVDQSNVHRL